MKLFLSLFFYSNVLWAGGASVVGDGGYVAVCSNQLELFDTFEYRVSRNKNLQVTLGEPANNNFNAAANLGFARMERRFKLTSSESKKMRRTFTALLQAIRSNPWAPAIDVDLVLSESVSTSLLVFEKLQADKCYLVTAIVKPYLQEDPFSEVAEFCKTVSYDVKNCFIVDKKSFSLLDIGSQACLAVHEILRFLPKEKMLHSERELRNVTAEICSE